MIAMRGPRGRRRGPARSRAPRPLLAALCAAALALVAGCSGAGALGTGGDAETVTVAIVSNPQMKDAIAPSPQFEQENPASGCGS